MSHTTPGLTQVSGRYRLIHRHIIAYAYAYGLIPFDCFWYCYPLSGLGITSQRIATPNTKKAIKLDLGR